MALNIMIVPILSPSRFQLVPVTSLCTAMAAHDSVPSHGQDGRSSAVSSHASQGAFLLKVPPFSSHLALVSFSGPWFKVSSKHRKQSTQCSRTSDSQHPNINVGHTCPNSLPCLSLRLSFQPGAKQSLMDIYRGNGNLLQPSLRHDLVSLVLPLKDLGHKIVLAGWGFPVSFPNTLLQISS